MFIINVFVIPEKHDKRSKCKRKAWEGERLSVYVLALAWNFLTHIHKLYWH